MVTKVTITTHSSNKHQTKRKKNRMGGIMVSVLPSSVVDLGFELQSGRVKPKIIKLLFVVREAPSIKENDLRFGSESGDSETERGVQSVH